MKKILLLSVLFVVSPCYAAVSEFFQGQDVNTVKAGISKYILSKGGSISHGGSYESNVIKAMERVPEKRGTYNYTYLFNIIPEETGTRVNMTITKALSGGGEPQNVNSEIEKIILNKILNQSKGRFLYGLGFEYEYYSTQNGAIKAPKGRESGIKLTAAKYDAQKQGLQAGDIIIKINGEYLKDIPIQKYATVLHAKSLTDTIELTYMRGGEVNTVVLTPRLSNAKVF